MKKPGIWDRKDGDGGYLDATVPLVSWPPFLSARADWIVGSIAFGAPSHLDRPEAHAFDLRKELPLVGSHEPLALYWLLRSYYLGERDVFDEVAPRARPLSALARGFAELLDERWSAKPKTSALAKVRGALARRKDLPRKAKWPKGMREHLT